MVSLFALGSDSNSNLVTLLRLPKRPKLSNSNFTTVFLPYNVRRCSLPVQNTTALCGASHETWSGNRISPKMSALRSWECSAERPCCPVEAYITRKKVVLQPDRRHQIRNSYQQDYIIYRKVYRLTLLFSCSSNYLFALMHFFKSGALLLAASLALVDARAIHVDKRYVSSSRCTKAQTSCEFSNSPCQQWNHGVIHGSRGYW